MESILGIIGGVLVILFFVGLAFEGGVILFGWGRGLAKDYKPHLWVKAKWKIWRARREAKRAYEDYGRLYRLQQLEAEFIERELNPPLVVTSTPSAPDSFYDKHVLGKWPSSRVSILPGEVTYEARGCWACRENRCDERHAPCPACGGSGEKNLGGGIVETCTFCGGKGWA